MMRSRLTAFVFCLLTLAAAVVPASMQGTRGPDNDSFASAQSIALNAKYKVTDVHEATLEGAEPAPSCQGDTYNSVWYKFTAPFSGYVTISATGSYIRTPIGNVPNPVLAVYTGASLGSLVEEACNPSFSSPVIYDLWLDLGVTYYIRIASHEVDTQAGSYYKLKTAVGTAAYNPGLLDLSFESNSAAWVLKNADNGDGRICEPTETYDGNCAYKFFGGPEEATKLQQKFTWPSSEVTGKRDHALILVGFLNAAAGTNANFKITIVTSYTDGKPKTKDSHTLTSDTASVYEGFGVTAIFAGTKIGDIKLVFKNKSTNGSVLVDYLQTLYFGGAVREAGAVLPVPSAAQ